MAGLIESKQYSASKTAICAETDGAEAAIEAIEWRLLHSETLEGLRRAPRSKDAHLLAVDATPSTPGVVVAVTEESFGGATKFLLLDVRLSEKDEQDE